MEEIDNAFTLIVKGHTFKEV